MSVLSHSSWGTGATRSYHLGDRRLPYRGPSVINLIGTSLKWRFGGIVSPHEIGHRIRGWLSGSSIREEQQALHSDTARIVDEDTDPIEGDVVRDPRVRRSFMASIVAETVNSIPGVQVDTPANRLVAKHRLNALCVAHGVRPTHIRTILPIALELVFVPSETDIEAVQFRNSRAVLDRIRERDRPWYTHERPWLFNWLGERRRRPVGGSA